MKHLPIALAVLLLAALARAQEPAAPPTPPKITAEQRAKWWKAVVDSMVANENAKKAAEKLSEVRAELVRTCEDALAADPDGEPACTAKATGKK